MTEQELHAASHPEVCRFPEDAGTPEEALQYFTARAIQALITGWVWDGSYFLHTVAGERLPRHTLPPSLYGFPGTLWNADCQGKAIMDVQGTAGSERASEQSNLATSEREGEKDEICAVEVHFTHAEYDKHMSVYVLAHARGQGLFPGIVAKVGLPVVTVDDCHITEYLERKSIPHMTFGKHESHDWAEYRLVDKFYGDKVTKRTGVHLINHIDIDEGLHVMVARNATKASMRAFCLHPLVQGDDDLAAFVAQGLIDQVDKYVLLLALEYRNIANAYLSHAPSSSTFSLSPLAEVNEMLVADKVQNRKDFQRFHALTHPRAERLAEYFSQWLARLAVSEEEYAGYTRAIVTATGLQQFTDAPSPSPTLVKKDGKCNTSPAVRIGF